MPHFLTKKYADIVDDPKAFDDALWRPLPRVFRVHEPKGSAGDVLASLARQEVVCAPLPWRTDAYRLITVPGPQERALDFSLGRSLPFLAGAVYVQEEVAMTAVAALDARPGETVFDMCAAPGGKTAQASLAVGRAGRVFASEMMNGRMAALGATTSRLALTNVAGHLGDARHVPFPCGSLDKVLCDVPCSGEGTARKVTGDWKEYDSGFLARLPAIQSQLLRRALHLTRPGGAIVYSTCTFRPEENEAVLHETLGSLGEVVPFSLPGFAGSPALHRLGKLAFRSDIAAHARRFWPHTHDTGGFFVALIRRTDEPTRRRSSADARKAATADEGTTNEKTSRWSRGGIDLTHLKATLDWFGVPNETLAPYTAWTRGNDKVWLADQSLLPLVGTSPEFLGFVAFKASQRRLWPTGFLLQMLGREVTRQFVDLPFEDALRYASGDDVEVAPRGRTEATNGPVQVRSGGFVLGKGSLSGSTLTSQVSKGLRFVSEKGTGSAVAATPVSGS